MKIYIAGPITGIFNYKENFMAAEEELKAKGHIVLNPSFLPDGLKDYMPTCKAMIDQADALYMLEGYQESKGAMEELEHANKNNKKVFMQSSHNEYLHNRNDAIDTTTYATIGYKKSNWHDIANRIKRCNARRGWIFD